MKNYECRCGKYLTGRQRNWCSDACRKRYSRMDKMAPAEVVAARLAEAARTRAVTAHRIEVTAKRTAPCPSCGNRVDRTPGRGRIKTYCSVTCRSKAQRERAAA